MLGQSITSSNKVIERPDSNYKSRLLTLSLLQHSTIVKKLLSTMHDTVTQRGRGGGRGRGAAPPAAPAAAAHPGRAGLRPAG